MKCSDMIIARAGKRIIDQEAETIEDMIKSTLLPRHALELHRNALLKSGHWEQVWKVQHGRTVKAYRPRRKK